jgi:hypothetical protein
LLPYDHVQRLVFHRIKDEPLCFGVEVELELQPEDEDGEEPEAETVAYAANKAMLHPSCKNFMFAKRDGSLSHGAEFVSQPFSWEWFKENIKRIEDFFHQVGSKGFVAEESCGLHIHASRAGHARVEEFRLLQLVYENAAPWERVSRRTNKMDYCHLTGGFTDYRERVRVAREKGSFKDRYVALNPTNKGTLEWRLWAGTDSFIRFAQCLAITASAHAFAKSGKLGLRPSFEKFVKFTLNHQEFAPFVGTALS